MKRLSHVGRRGVNTHAHTRYFAVDSSFINLSKALFKFGNMLINKVSLNRSMIVIPSNGAILALCDKMTTVTLGDTHVISSVDKNIKQHVLCMQQVSSKC